MRVARKSRTKNVRCNL